jgi:hypothetical protein
MAEIIVRFYRLNHNGIKVECRTEYCYSIMEADFLAAEEMSTGQYTEVIISET